MLLPILIFFCSNKTRLLLLLPMHVFIMEILREKKNCRWFQSREDLFCQKIMGVENWVSEKLWTNKKKNVISRARK